MTAIQKAREALRSLATVTRFELGDNVAREPWKRLLTNADAALAALDAETEVKVRELEWSKTNERDTLSRAKTPIGVYRVWTHHEANGRWWWDLDGYEKQFAQVASEADGHAAAQADFERRIRSALVTPESRS